MKKERRFISLFILLCCFCLCISGCASVSVANPKYKTDHFLAKKILIAPSDIIVYKITAGGITEQIDEWMEKANRGFEESFEFALSERCVPQVKLLKISDLPSDNQGLFKSQKALYRAVARSIDMHVCEPQGTISAKKRNFDYSLGPYFDYLSKPYNADMILFIYGASIKATTGRWLMSVFYGLVNLGLAGTISMPVTDGSKVYFSLVDSKSGDVIWFYRYYDPQGSLMPPGKVQKIVKKVVSNMPFEKKR